MVERLVINIDDDVMRKDLGSSTLPKIPERFNAAPTQKIAFISTYAPQKFNEGYWGIEPSMSNNRKISGKLINAPIDTLENKISYKRALEQRRCIIPASGFYAWKSISKKGLVPYYLRPVSLPWLPIAALWEQFTSMEGQKVTTFTLITHLASKTIQHISENEPLVLSRLSLNQWLSPTTPLHEIQELLSATNSVNYSAVAVSNKVNNLANDSIELLNPAPPADQFGNYTLFE